MDKAMMDKILSGSYKMKDSTERLLKRDDIGDPVNHPSHYTMGKIEVCDFVDSQNDIGVSHNILCAIEYLCRAPWKGNQVQDLQKAIWRCQHEIDRVKETWVRDHPNVGSMKDGD